jgi:hypothetical protein
MNSLVSVVARSITMSRLRTLRGILAACAVALYVLAGALHGICGLDVANPSGTSELSSLTGKHARHADETRSGEHHCHGCFSVTMPQTSAAAVIDQVPSSTYWVFPVGMRGILIEAQSPPPKHLI